MALTAYLRIAGRDSGPVTGIATARGFEGWIPVIGASHEVEALPEGRVHHPFVVTKEIDRTTPVLYRLLAGAEPLTGFELRFRAMKEGLETHVYTVRLTGARLADIRFFMPNLRDPDEARLVEFEDVSFTYDRIEWVWVDGDVRAEDAGK
jgi:type VI secretion system secreted protein Hcp